MSKWKHKYDPLNPDPYGLMAAADALPSELLTAKELAKALKSSSSQVYVWYRQGTFPAHKFGKKVLFDLHEVLKATRVDHSLHHDAERDFEAARLRAL